MRLKIKRVVSRSNPSWAKKDVVRRVGPGSNPWDEEAQTLRWTEAEFQEIQRYVSALNITYSDFIRAIKQLYWEAMPSYEAFCDCNGEAPTDDGLREFAFRALYKEITEVTTH